MPESFISNGSHQENAGRPRLSVVIPAYNSEKYLRACLESLTHQSLREIEIILVDDGSTDGTENIAREYATRDARVIYLKHEKNRGQGAARNTGIKHATANWISFADSDDYLDSDCYANVLKLIERHQADGAVFSFEEFDDETGIKGNYITRFRIKFSNPTRFSENFSDLIDYNCTVWNRVFRRSDLVGNDIWFPESIKHEDEEFLFKYFAKIQPLMVGDERKYYKYRISPTSTMSGLSQTRRDVPRILENILNFLEFEGLSDRYRNAYLRTLSGFCEASYRTLAEEHRDGFEKDIIVLLDRMRLTEGEFTRLAPLIYSFYIEEPLVKRSFFAKRLHLGDVIQNNKWYRFGKLSRKQKIRFAVRYIVDWLLRREGADHARGR